MVGNFLLPRHTPCIGAPKRMQSSMYCFSCSQAALSPGGRKVYAMKITISAPIPVNRQGSPCGAGCGIYDHRNTTAMGNPDHVLQGMATGHTGVDA